MASLSIANFVPLTGTHDISAQGFTDWALWNSASANGTNKVPSQRKSGGGSLIGNLTCSVAQLESFTAALQAISWTGGTPTASGSNTNGEYNNLNSSGTTTNGANCSWTFPVGTAGITARVYLGAFASNVTISASLSDGSAGPASNTSMTNGRNDGADSSYGYLDITAAAGSAGQTLTVTATAAAAGFAQFSDVEPVGAGIIVAAGGSTITAAAGAATTSTLAGAATKAAAITAAAGAATASSMAGRSTAAAAISSAAGTSTASTLAGRAIVSAAITPAAGSSTTSSLGATSTAAATIGAAAGAATASTLQGASTAAASISPAAGSATAATMVGSSTAPGAGAIVPAAGQATTSALAGSSIVAASFVPASGAATTSTMASNGVSPVTQGGMGFEMSSRPIREVRIKPLLQRVLEARNSRRVRPQRDRAAERAKRIEVQAAQMLLDDDATRAEFEGLLSAWRVQRPQVPEDVAPVEAFMSQVAFRIEQLGEMQHAIVMANAQKRARNDEEALVLLLMA